MNVFRKILNILTERGRVINPGAECPIISNPILPPPELAEFKVDAQGRPSISVGHQVEQRDLQLVHEFCHYIEWTIATKVPDSATKVIALMAVRHAFRSLCAPGYEYGHADLEKELTPNQALTLWKKGT